MEIKVLNIESCLEQIPHFEKFRSVGELADLAECLRTDPAFDVREIGRSVGGVPIHHIIAGTGRTKALVVAGPHAMEPIGSLTVASLLDLLQRDVAGIRHIDVEWHVIPCIDPDGAILNEGWTQKPFTFENYIKNFYVQPISGMVDTTFPVRHKRLRWTEMTHEANILKGVIDEVMPDFFFSLHNAWIGGAHYFISQDIGGENYRRLYDLLDREGFPLQRRGVWSDLSREFADGVMEMFDVTKHYDYVEKSSDAPEDVANYGASSRYYLSQVKPSAVSFVVENGYIRHHDDESEALTGQNLRKLQLELDAGNRWLASIMLEEWEKIGEKVARDNPFYRSVAGGFSIPLSRQKIIDGGMPLSWYPTRTILETPQNDREMREADRFNACMITGGAFFLRLSYQLVRLLELTPADPEIARALARIKRAYDEVFASIGRHVDLDAFEVIPCDTLTRIQLGSGLIVLSAIIERNASASATIDNG